MKINGDFISQLEELFKAYEKEVNLAYEKGLLTESTRRTYLLHSGNFVKWNRDDFRPGSKNM